MPHSSKMRNGPVQKRCRNPLRRPRAAVPSSQMRQLSVVVLMLATIAGCAVIAVWSSGGGLSPRGAEHEQFPKQSAVHRRVLPSLLRRHLQPAQGTEGAAVDKGVYINEIAPFGTDGYLDGADDGVPCASTVSL